MTIHCGKHRPYNFVIHGVTSDDFSQIHMSKIHSDLEHVASEIIEQNWPDLEPTETETMFEVTVRNPRNYQEQTFIVRAEPRMHFHAYVKPEERVRP